MRRHAALIACLLLVGAVLAGCASRQPASTAYTVDQNGTVSAGTRSALDGTNAPGRQELFGLFIPVGPFGVKAGIDWDGTTWTWPAPSAQAATASPQAAACEEVMVQETYTEMVPVQRTRSVPQKRVTIPVPRAAPQQCPCPPVAQAQPGICSAPAIEVAEAPEK